MAHCSPVSVPTQASPISREVSAPINSEQSSKFEYLANDWFAMTPLISPVLGPYNSNDVETMAINICSLGLPIVKTLSTISNNEYIRTRRSEGLALGVESIQKPYLRNVEPISCRLQKGIFKWEMEELDQLLTIQCRGLFKIEIPPLQTPEAPRTYIYSLIPQHYHALNVQMFRLGLIAKDGFLVFGCDCWPGE